MRVFLAGVSHETSAFSPIPTNRRSFADWQLWRPADGPPPDTVDLLGYGEVLRLGTAAGCTMLPSLYGMAMPSAPMSRAEWEALKREVLADLEAALPVDGVFLFLHGAQSASEVDDCEGDLVAAIRQRVGDAPIAVELDLHGNISHRLLSNATLVFACKEYPHVDFVEEARRGFEALHDTVRGKVMPTIAAAKVPAFGVYPTMVDPMRSLVARLRKLEESGEVLFASVLHGFYGSDNPDTGASVIVVTDADQAKATRLCSSLADEALEVMCRMPQGGMDIEAAIDLIQNARDLPVVLADTGDNPGAGAGGDSTFLLRRLLERGVENVAIGMMWDPVAVDIAHLAGVGAELDMRIGGRLGTRSGVPLDLRVRVTSIKSDVRQALFGGDVVNQELGKSAAVRVNGIDIVLNSVRQQVMSTHCFLGHGIDPAKLRAVVVKSAQHFYASFSPVAGVIAYCKSPGAASMDFSHLQYHRVRRPIYPLDVTGLRTQRLFPTVEA